MTDHTTGYFRRGRREMRNRKSVRFGENAAKALITFGGLGTIIAVSGVFLFLLWVVKDLFLSAEVGEGTTVVASPHARVLATGADEYRVLGWMLREDGVLQVVGLRDGKQLAEHALLQSNDTAPPRITAVSPSIRSTRPDQMRARVDFAFGLADGTARTCRIDYLTSYYEADQVPEEVRGLQMGNIATWASGITERTPIGQYRVQVLEASVGQPIRLTPDSAVVAIHLSENSNGPLIGAVSANGTANVADAEQRENLMTGEVVLEWNLATPLPLPEHTDKPAHIAVTDLGTNATVLWPDGQVARFAIRSLDEVALAEQLDLLADPIAQVTGFGVLLGESTLLVGDSTGVVGGWFIRNDASNEVDGTRLVLGHRLALSSGSAPVSFASSERDRMFVAGGQDGSLHAMFMTSEKHLVETHTGRGYPVQCLAVTPKDDGLLAVDERGMMQWDFDPRHPEVTFGALFGKVWYERYESPTYVWQSSSATDDFEKKFSLVPLIFGTVKATAYSMLFGVPLALLAAIYTSQFLSRRARSRIKPLIELMASLPSVVLGFLAALVIAPIVEKFVPTVLCTMITVPFAVLLGAYLWRMLPPRYAPLLERYRLFAVAVALSVGLWLATALAPAAEYGLFAGDIRLWLDRQAGSGLPALIIVLLPVSALAVALLSGRYLNPRLRTLTAEWSPQRVATIHMGKFGLGLTTVVGFSASSATILYWIPALFGGDPLDLRAGVHFGEFDLSPIATLDQRNALVVGFVMGFAVIPIIYTLAEDALSSVPEHLRAASLGAGATPWQTATRIIIPTAMSGLFSSIMIGLGRAVGETMIVLMAAGNTPVLSMNIFSGFRTLSANIATELPEAAENTTHYRTLYLAALVLFAMTFIINTLAESVRIRFRKRAYEL